MIKRLAGLLLISVAAEALVNIALSQERRSVSDVEAVQSVTAKKEETLEALNAFWTTEKLLNKFLFLKKVKLGQNLPRPRLELSNVQNPPFLPFLLAHDSKLG